ncbi:hypothetical protein Tco_0966383 [Tanacetum coccineum]
MPICQSFFIIKVELDAWIIDVHWWVALGLQRQQARATCGAAEADPKGLQEDIPAEAVEIRGGGSLIRPKAKGIVFYDQEEQAYAFTPIVSSSQLPQAKDKGKGKMVEPEKPLKKKDQIALDEELALRLHAEEQAELEKERVAQKEASRASNIKELDSIQAMISGEAYDKVFNHLDMLHASLEVKGFITTASCLLLLLV